MDQLVVRGARDNNLSDLDVSLPLRRLVVFCGVSGSGKSSLAFDTLHREGQRRYLEAMLLGRARLRRPDVAGIDGLPPTIGLDQRERAAAGDETIAGVSELLVGLAVLFGRAGEARCPRCGAPVVPRTHDAIVAELMRLPEGARLTIEAPVAGGAGVLDEIARAGFSRVRVGAEITRIDALSGEPAAPFRVVVDRIKLAPERRGRIAEAVRLAGRVGRGELVVERDGEGPALRFVDRPRCVACALDLPPNEPGRFRVRAGQPGLGLDDAARAVQVSGRTLPDLLALTLDALAAWVDQVDATEVTRDLLGDLSRRLAVLRALGLGALPGDRAASDASRGELVRLRLARQVSSGVSGVLYVLDEPAAGLDDGAAGAVVAVLRTLVDQGNTVLAVDHHPEVVRAADHVVEFGPGAGERGGRIVYAGPPGGLVAADTPTGALLAGRLVPERPASPPGRSVTLGGVAVREGGVTVITGPSGAGKTRLLASLRAEGVVEHERVLSADVGSLARVRRSNAATYTGLWTVLRELLAQTREARVLGFSASTFSLNAKGGRCESCQGAGEVRVSLDPLPDVWMRCPVCEGRRFQADVLGVSWKGLAPDALLELSVEAAHPLLAGVPKLERPLRALRDVGLSYLQLGRAADTLSGGEMRRLQLARELGRATGAGLVVADEPSLGLHPADTVSLMRAFARLAEEGATVVIASADPFVVGSAHEVVALG